MERLAAFIVSLLAITSVVSASQAVPPQPGTQSERYRIEVAVDLVNVNFSATDSKGRMVPGLRASDFTVEEDGKTQTISLFSRERELPLTLALLVDVSPSVQHVF